MKIFELLQEGEFKKELSISRSEDGELKLDALKKRVEKSCSQALKFADQPILRACAVSTTL